MKLEYEKLYRHSWSPEDESVNGCSAASLLELPRSWHLWLRVKYLPITADLLFILQGISVTCMHGPYMEDILQLQLFYVLHLFSKIYQSIGWTATISFLQTLKVPRWCISVPGWSWRCLWCKLNWHFFFLIEGSWLNIG